MFSARPKPSIDGPTLGRIFRETYTATAARAAAAVSRWRGRSGVHFNFRVLSGRFWAGDSGAAEPPPVIASWNSAKYLPGPSVIHAAAPSGIGRSDWTGPRVRRPLRQGPDP